MFLYSSVLYVLALFSNTMSCSSTSDLASLQLTSINSLSMEPGDIRLHLTSFIIPMFYFSINYDRTGTSKYPGCPHFKSGFVLLSIQLDIFNVIQGCPHFRGLD